MKIDFVLIAEGPSDYALVSHLERLCINCGATEVTGAAIEFNRLPGYVGRSVLDKLSIACRLEPQANLFFIHRDADSRDSSPRYEEIRYAVEACQFANRWVAVVPVQETEAWLLLNELEIRKVAKKPRGRTPLNLPNANQVENVASPKERLQETLIQAGEVTGRHLDRFKRSFTIQRKLLLERLPVDGPISTIPSWMRMRDDLRRVIEDVEVK